VNESVKLAYGDSSPVLANKQVAAVQSLSGTGSCRLFAEFQKRFLPNSTVYIPTVRRRSPPPLPPTLRVCVRRVYMQPMCGMNCAVVQHSTECLASLTSSADLYLAQLTIVTGWHKTHTDVFPAPCLPSVVPPCAAHLEQPPQYMEGC
jgi:hypothetical protein